MNSKQATKPRELHDRATADHITVNGRRVTRGTEISIVGIRGRCQFIQAVHTTDGRAWVDVITNRGFARTVRPDTIRTVHTRRTGVDA